MRPLDESYNPAQRRQRHHRANRNDSVESAPVLYIHPAKQGPDFTPETDTGRPYGLIPLGLPAVVNVLRANGIRVKGIIHPLEKQMDPWFDLRKWLSQQKDVRIILIDMHWYEHCYGAVETARACKEVLPSAWTIIGGLSATGFAREILENFPCVDFVVRGDAEKPLLALAQRLLAQPAGQLGDLGLEDLTNLTYRAGHEGTIEIVDSPCSYVACTEDLDSLDFVDLDFIAHADEYLVHEYIVTNLTEARRALETRPYRGRWTCTARGCKFHCSYCGGSKESHLKLANRNGIVIRSPEKVVDDIRRLAEKGVDQVSLSYDIAQLGEEYWRTFFSLLRKSGIKIGLYNEFFQLPAVEFIAEYAKSVDMVQSSVALSPLSGNERVRRLNGKHYSTDKMFDVLDELSQYRFYLFVYFSLNLPGETLETYEQTIDLAKSVYDFYPPSLLKILNTVHTLDPLSPMNMYPEKYGIVTSMSTFMDFYAYCRDTRQGGAGARTELNRGYRLSDPAARNLELMSNAWDRAREGREASWWPVPPSW